MRLLRVMDGLADGMAVDDDMGFTDALSLARKASGLDSESIALPVTGFTAPGGASALQLAGGADEVLDRFR